MPPSHRATRVQLRRTRRVDVVAPASSGAAGVVAAARGAGRARGRGARPARRAAGRRPARRGRGWGCRPRGRPTRCPSHWPTRWWGTVRAQVPSRSRAADAPACVDPCHVGVVGAGPEVRVDGARGARRPGRCRSDRDRCSRCAPSGAAAAPISAVAGGLLGPRRSGAARATSCAGWAPARSQPGSACGRDRGRRLSAIISWRAPPPSSNPTRLSCSAWSPDHTTSGSAPTRWRD